MAIVTNTISAHPTSHDTTNISYYSVNSSHQISAGYTDSNSTTYAQVHLTRNSNAETYVYYNFDFSEIPDNATNISVTAKAKGYVNTTNTSRVPTRQMQLCTIKSNITFKGDALTMSSSATEQTFSTVGSWTLDDVQHAAIRFYCKRGTSNTTTNYYMRMYGATMTVTYEYNDIKYTITVNNSTSATVTADPEEVSPGGSSEIRSDTLSGLIITDNGTDVTSQFTQRTDTGSYYLENRGNYGFALSGSYYVSQNKGVDKTAAVTRVHFNLPSSGTVTFTFINYAEQGYDFGVFGNIDTALSTDYYAAGSSGATITDSSYKLACNSSTYNKSTTQTLSYSMSAGEHYIDVKYSKDDASAANNDTLQFSVAISGVAATYYGYDITNIQADHVIVVSQSGSGPTLYVKENGTWNVYTRVYIKQNGSWVEQASSTWSTLFNTSTNYVKG